MKSSKKLAELQPKTLTEKQLRKYFSILFSTQDELLVKQNLTNKALFEGDEEKAEKLNAELWKIAGFLQGVQAVGDCLGLLDKSKYRVADKLINNETKASNEEDDVIKSDEGYC